MLKGFRDFIMRGNVVDLAVGVVVGVAFNGLVVQFTTDFMNPLIKLFGGGKPLSGQWTFRSQHFLWADFINAIINFILIAAVLYYLVVMPLNKLADRRARSKAAAAAATPAADIVLLSQIRDALVSMDSRLATAGATGAPAQRSGGTDV